MYELYYEQLLGYSQDLCGHISILGGDTDSFFLEIKNIELETLKKRMKDDGLLDTSNYPKDHPLFSDAHKAQIGLVKDEMCGRAIREWVHLRPKCYSLETEEGQGSAALCGR